MTDDSHSFLKDSIKSCIKCSFKHNHSNPLFFSCRSPENVKCLVVTEQPKENSENIITEESLRQNIIEQIKNNKGSTVGGLVRLLGNPFTESIIKESGSYYWTHHTKCPSRKREYKKECMNHWFINELGLYKNLSSIISFGSETYRGIASISDGVSTIDYYEYFWNEIEMVVKRKIDFNKLKIRIKEKDYYLLVLPHPSGANPLSHLLSKIDFILEKFKEQFIS